MEQTKPISPKHLEAARRMAEEKFHTPVATEVGMMNMRQGYAQAKAEDMEEIERLKAQLNAQLNARGSVPVDLEKEARAFAHDIESNYDHDEDAHRYGHQDTQCRCCIAEAFLKRLDILQGVGSKQEPVMTDDQVKDLWREIVPFNAVGRGHALNAMKIIRDRGLLRLHPEQKHEL